MPSSSSRSYELPGLDTKEESSRNPPAITTMIMNNKTTKNRILAAAGADVVNKNKKQHKKHLLRLVEKLMDVKSKIPEELLQNILVDLLIPAPLHNRTPLTAATGRGVNLAEVIRNVSKTISSLRRSAVMEKDDASKVVEISEKAAFRIIETMTQKAGKFLQSHLDDRKHTEANVKAIVQVFPCALSSKDSEGFSSITYASRRKESISFVPLLAEESRRPNISSCSAGSNIVDRRGGLVSEDAEESRGQLCALKNIVRMQKRNSFSQRSSSDDNDETDQRCLQLLERLRASGLFVKEDIRKHKLLYWSCKPEAKARFNYIVEWDPDALIETEIRGQPMIHFLIIFQKKYRPLSAYLSNFSMMIEAGLKYHPEKLGLFFVKSRCGESVYNAACRSFCTNGKKQVWKIAHRCLEAGEADTIERMIGKVDPTTSLYPFLKAAAGGRESSSLDILYYVLRRDPVIFESIIDDEVAGRSAANRKRGLKSAETNNRLDVEKNNIGTTKKRKRQFE